MANDQQSSSPSNRKAGHEWEERDELLVLPNEDSEHPVFAPDGTDLTLIRDMLTKSPEERIRALEAMVETIYRLRDARKA